MTDLAQQVVWAVEKAIGPATELVLLHKPYLPETAWEYVKECLDTGWVSSAGSYVTRFEEELARFTGCRRAVATVNGTAALEVCLHLAGVKPGDEVLCPSLSFVATANAISHCGASPHFVDVSEDRMTLCPQALETRLREIAKPGPSGLLNRLTGRRVAALCPMHCFGHPSDMQALCAIAARYDLPVIEDAAESLGSTLNGKHTGRFGLLSAVSFNGNKILTTGGGGAILTDDDELADQAKHLTTTAKVPHAWEFRHDQVAWNFRMPNINAALGVAQLEVLPAMIDAKRTLAEAYFDAFRDVEGITVLHEPPDCRSNYWLNCLLITPRSADVRDDILRKLNEANFQARPLWQPMHCLPMYGDCSHGSLAATENAYAKALNIPSSVELSQSWGKA